MENKNLKRITTQEDLEEGKKKAFEILDGVSPITEEEINGLTRESLRILYDEMMLSLDYKKAARIAELLIEMKKAYFPAVQKNINANVDLFEEQVRKWKEFQKQRTQQGGIIITTEDG